VSQVLIGGSVTYSFTATHPGTFIYESGTNQGIQVPLGLFGALVVRPTAGEYYVYDDAGLPQTSEFNHGWTDQMGNYISGEFLVLQSEVDPYLSQAIERWAEQGQPLNFDMNNYHPRYWFLNGRGFPDTLAPNYASWLPSQPYGALAHIVPNVEVPGDPQLLHYLERFGNVSSQVLPFHPHGRNALVIGRDAQPLRGAAGQDLSGETFALTAAPGQTYDALFHYHNLEGYDPVNNPIPVTDPGWQNLTYGPMYGGSPYLGVMGPLQPGNPSQNMCGEYYIIAHNHALFQLTSWGVVMTGPGTFLRIDPPGGCPMP
jgi:FtsP/CotA-like multicopper oxidase with cupredoxin domain